MAHVTSFNRTAQQGLILGLHMQCVLPSVEGEVGGGQNNTKPAEDVLLSTHLTLSAACGEALASVLHMREEHGHAQQMLMGVLNTYLRLAGGSGVGESGVGAPSGEEGASTWVMHRSQCLSASGVRGTEGGRPTHALQALTLDANTGSTGGMCTCNVERVCACSCVWAAQRQAAAIAVAASIARCQYRLGKTLDMTGALQTWSGVGEGYRLQFTHKGDRHMPQWHHTATQQYTPLQHCPTQSCACLVDSL